jgi:hypothetical protein
MAATEKHRDSPTYWFAILEMARERGRFQEAQHALDELRRLGVHVRFGRPRNPRPRSGGPIHAA